MTPEISFKVVIFGQTEKEYYTYLFEYIWKIFVQTFFSSLNILVKQTLPLPPTPIFSKTLF